jgi:hypothetical protein
MKQAQAERTRPHVYLVNIARVVSLSLLLVSFSCSKSSTRAKPVSEAQHILGVPLPASASDVRLTQKAGVFGGDYFLSASISREDFSAVAQQLKMQHRPDLLDYWGSALRAHDVPWWHVTVTNDADTLFREENSTFLVARFEKGRLFFKRHVY